jgi:hypothetical protein
VRGNNQGTLHQFDCTFPFALLITDSMGIQRKKWATKLLRIFSDCTVPRLILVAFLGPVQWFASQGASLTLEWAASPFEDQVAGYKVYLATEEENFPSIDVGLTNRYSLSNPSPNSRYLIFVTAYNQFQFESAPSEIIRYPAAAPCLVAISPAASFFSSARTSDSFTIYSPTDCPFLATTDDSWITVTSVTSVGGATLITYRAKTNRGRDPRLGFISTGARRFAVFQAGQEPGPPVLLSHLPGEAIIDEDQPLELGIEVEEEDEAVQYQWLKNDVPIDGATSSSFSIPALSSADSGQYSVEVADSQGVATDGPLNLSVYAKPRIRRGPTVDSIDGDLYLTVEASGSDLHFAWRLNGDAISVDSAHVLIESASQTNFGTFQVSVSNKLGFAQSEPVRITSDSIGQSSGLIHVTLQPDLTLRVQGEGIPGDVYEMQSSRDLVHWQFLDSVTVSESALFTIEAPAPATDSAGRWFVRTVRRPAQ